MVGDDDSDPAEPKMIGILSAEARRLVKLFKIDFYQLHSASKTKNRLFVDAFVYSYVTPLLVFPRVQTFSS